MLFEKFIVETDDEIGNYLIIGKCQFHRELAHDVAKIKGGGDWRRNEEKTEIVLSGESYEFKSVPFEILKDCIKNKKVFTNWSLSNNITDNYDFYWKDFFGETVNLKD